jgi:nicotinamidase-related amidase
VVLEERAEKGGGGERSAGVDTYFMFAGKKIVLTGYMAHVCVSTTARQAEQRGYEVLLTKDGIGDRDIPGAIGEEVTEMVMNELGDAVGTVVQGSSIK